MNLTDALAATNEPFQGRKALLEVVTDSMIDIATDNGFGPPPKPRARRGRRVIPTVEQGGEHSIVRTPHKPKPPEPEPAPPEPAIVTVQAPKVRRG